MKIKNKDITIVQNKSISDLYSSRIKSLQHQWIMAHGVTTFSCHHNPTFLGIGQIWNDYKSPTTCKNSVTIMNQSNHMFLQHNSIASHNLNMTPIMIVDRNSVLHHWRKQKYWKIYKLQIRHLNLCHWNIQRI